MITLDTAADVANYTGTDDLAFVSGLATPFDGAEGFWVRRDNWTGQTNTGTVIADAMQRRWVRQYDHVIDAKWFGAAEDKTDNRAALQMAIDASVIEGHCAVVIPRGRYQIDGALSVSGVTFSGTSQLFGTHIIQTKPGADAFVSTGEVGGMKLGGCRLRNLWIDAATGVAAGAAVRLGGDATYQPDGFELDGIRMSGEGQGAAAGTWANCIAMNGTLRTSPPGIRGGIMRSIEAFNCRQPSVVVWGGAATKLEGVNCYTGFGQTALAGLWVGGTTAVNSWGVKLESCHTEGPVNISNSSQIMGRGNRFGCGRQIHTPTTSYIDVDNLLGT